MTIAQKSRLRSWVYPPGNTLLHALQKPGLYDHSVKSFSLIETHISWILLTGDYAYKIKKPVDLGFVNFSTLEKRKFYCAEELRLNRRFAPDLYLDVVSIRGSVESPYFDGNTPIIDYAVKMKEFSQFDLASTMAAEHRLQKIDIDSMASEVSRIHIQINIRGSENMAGYIESVSKWSLENFEKITATFPPEVLSDNFEKLKLWCSLQTEPLLLNMQQRMLNGHVRECHGDLHLANIAIIQGQVRLFDCLEFNPELRWIDTMSEIAFVTMDLQARGYAGYAWRFVNRYLADSGDYQGLLLLRYYLVYRALVRTKMEGLRITQEHQIDNSSFAAETNSLYQSALNYLDIAADWATNSRPAVIVMHGLSGSGKSTIASQLLENLGAIQIRSDIERKRLFKLKAQEDSKSELDEGLYSQDATKLTYTRLAELTQLAISAGFTVIVDATFLKRSQRDQFRLLALENQASHIIISCEADEKTLRARIKLRSESCDDASEANQAVLDRQLLTQDLLSPEDHLLTFTLISTNSKITAKQLAIVKNKLSVDFSV